MSEDIVVSCGECETDVEVVIGPDGIEDGGHYSTILLVDNEYLTDDASLVNEHIDPDNMREDQGAIAYAVCGDCCPHC